MTPAALKSTREALGLSQAGFARLLGLHGAAPDRTVRRWELGERAIPDAVQTLLWLIGTAPAVLPALKSRAAEISAQPKR